MKEKQRNVNATSQMQVFYIWTYNSLTVSISTHKGVKFSADFSTETSSDAEEVPGKAHA